METIDCYGIINIITVYELWFICYHRKSNYDTELNVNKKTFFLCALIFFFFLRFLLYHVIIVNF